MKHKTNLAQLFIHRVVSLATIIGAGLLLASLSRASSTTYTYDALGRLTDVAVTAGTSSTIHYGFDAAGNRLQVGPTGGSGGSSPITISNRIVTTRIANPSATAVFVLTNAGDIVASQATSNTTTVVGSWLSPKTGMNGFDVRATLVGPTSCTGGTMGTWLNLGTSQSWNKNSGAPGSFTCTFTLEFRQTSNPSVILGTAQITLTAIDG